MSINLMFSSLRVLSKEVAISSSVRRRSIQRPSTVIVVCLNCINPRKKRRCRYDIVAMKFENLAPARNKAADDLPWQGTCPRKPWEYRVTAVVPVIDTPDSLELCVEILRLQTERPYIIVVDTGSSADSLEKILEMHAEDLEVHCLRHNGMLHPSDPVCVAMDMAQSMCRTEYMFATHSDAFLMRQDYIEWLLSMCGSEDEGLVPVVGYEMSPRGHDDWRGMVSHTATMYHIPTLDKIGFGWSMRRLASICEMDSHAPHPDRPNWPDTEILGNMIMRENGVKTKIIGGEKNFERNRDENIDHARSISLGMLYSPDYHRAASKWFDEAKSEARDRIEMWKNQKTIGGK